MQADLFILYTNWGRIGQSFGGQYQNTPFGTAEQAVQEFEKIFKLKSGNDWANKANGSFEDKKNKYRLVDMDKIKWVKKSALDIDLESSIPSKLPKSIQMIISDLANVSMYVNAYKAIGIDYQAVPFGRIKRDQVLKAKTILEELKKLIANKQSLEIKRNKLNARTFDPNCKPTDKEKKDVAEGELHKVVEKVASLTTDYYYLMPKSGFEFDKLAPIDSEYLWKDEMTRVDHMLEFEVAERFLLGAQYRKEEVYYAI